MKATAAAPAWRRDALWAVGALLALLGWELSGWDLVVAHWVGDVHGFGWRDAWATRALLHEGGRAAAALLLSAMAFDAWRPRVPGPGRARRLHGFALVLACLLAVPALKRVSATSCPWDLAEFGGAAAYVPHWRLGIADGGAGHCFPSGHAVAAFAFFALYFQWRGHRPVRARAWLAGVLAAGALFGTAQLLRGAHFPSHTLWSGWLCWVLCALGDRLPALHARYGARSTASTSEWNSRRYSTQTTAAVAAANAQLEKNQAVAANAK